LCLKVKSKSAVSQCYVAEEDSQMKRNPVTGEIVAIAIRKVLTIKPSPFQKNGLNQVLQGSRIFDFVLLFICAVYLLVVLRAKPDASGRRFGHF
jgi:hypothetical protein